MDRVSLAAAGRMPARVFSLTRAEANSPLPLRERVANAVGASPVRGAVAKQPLTRSLLALLEATAPSRKGKEQQQPAFKTLRSPPTNPGCASIAFCRRAFRI